MDIYLERMELLIGKEGITRLKEACVMVIGVGGVGSYAAEALARSGIGTLILVDHDTIAPSNLNRQIHADFATIGQSKTAVMKKRIYTYRNDIQVICHDEFYCAQKQSLLFSEPVDFIVDAIDTNRWDPSQLQVSELMKTKDDPLAKVMRQQVRKRGIKGKIPVVCSRELPYVQRTVVDADGLTRKQKMPPASTPFVPSAAGLLCASQAVKHILSKIE